MIGSLNVPGVGWETIINAKLKVNGSTGVDDANKLDISIPFRTINGALAWLRAHRNVVVVDIEIAPMVYEEEALNIDLDLQRLEISCEGFSSDRNKRFEFRPTTSVNDAGIYIKNRTVCIANISGMTLIGNQSIKSGLISYAAVGHIGWSEISGFTSHGCIFAGSITTLNTVTVSDCDIGLKYARTSGAAIINSNITGTSIGVYAEAAIIFAESSRISGATPKYQTYDGIIYGGIVV